MAYRDKIKSLLRPIVRFFRWLFDVRTPELSVEFVPAITRYFLSDIIELRVQAKKDKPDGPPEATNAEIVKDFSTRVEQAIRQVAKNPKLTSRAQDLLSGDLSDIKLDSAFTDDTWKSPDYFLEILCAPGTFSPRASITRADALIIVCLVLRAIQELILNVVRKDYPLQNPVLEVPLDMKAAMRKAFRRVDDLWREYSSQPERQSIDPSLQPKSANTLETELRLLMARNTGSACLPLRPIPTSPLGNDDFSKPYAGVPTDEILRLSRQIRHADGSVLVSGYRGVGKSTFVNRIIYEALAAQEDFPADQCLIVPVTVNLAKVSGVQNVLRITLRTVRETLLEEDNRQPRLIPTRRTGDALEDANGNRKGLGQRILSKIAPKLVDQPQNQMRLPLTREEIDELNEAYLRAVYKVKMDASVVTENSREYGGSLNLDPGQIFGGLASLKLGGLSAAIKRKRVEGLNRSVGYMDYDENAAEDDLRWLIGHLARFRPYRELDGRKVRIKLVFVFDELDKMDVETGLKPMIEGLKNLFLQQSAVFFLVTSKKFYYDLLKDRAIEDAMLNSYFSAVVNVPLLRYSHAYEIVDKWVDRDASDELKRSSPNEEELVKRLARVLVYRSSGNPRDMIRELRRMQEWSDTQQPFLSDQGDAAKSFQIFAAIQNCVELTVGQSAQSNSDPGTVAVISDRLLGDEARLEQVRRGLYILIEELISRQRLVITRAATPTSGGTLPPTADKPAQPDVQMMSPSAISSLMEQWVNLNKPQPTSAALSVLEKIQQDNFSLVSLEDVQNLARKLGGFLKNIHLTLDLPEDERSPLFELRGGEELFVTANFYALTGRTASAAATATSTPQKIDPKRLAEEAKFRSEQKNWQDKESAINLIKQLPTDQISKELQEFLIETARSAPDANYRQMAAEALNYKMLFGDKSRDISTLLTAEPDDRVLSVYLNLLGEAPDAESRLGATKAILDLLKADAAATRKLTESAATLFTVLPTVADEDVTDDVLNWLATASVNELQLSTALEAFTKLAQKAHLDAVEKIIGNRKFLVAFLNDNRWDQFILQVSRKASVLKTYLQGLLRANPWKYSAALLNVDADINVNDLLAYTWDLGFQPHEDTLADQIFGSLSSPQMKTRVMESIRLIPKFETRLLPYLQIELDHRKEKLGEDAAKSLQESLTELKAKPAAQAAKADKPGSLADFIKKRTTDYFDPLQSRSYDYAPTYTRKRPIIYWVSRALGGLIIGSIAFLPGLFFYRRDLPAGAAFGKVLQSRLILLALDLSIFFPTVTLIRTTDRVVKNLRQNQSFERTWMYSVTVLFALIGPLIDAHTQNIGPLHFWNQVIQMLINIPAMAFICSVFLVDD